MEVVLGSTGGRQSTGSSFGFAPAASGTSSPSTSGMTVRSTVGSNAGAATESSRGPGPSWSRRTLRLSSATHSAFRMSACEVDSRTHLLSPTQMPVHRNRLESRQFASVRWACDPRADEPTRTTTSLAMEEVAPMASSCWHACGSSLLSPIDS
jgi:hypothetical protein